MTSNLFIFLRAKWREEHLAILLIPRFSMESGRKVRGIVVPLARRINKRMFERHGRREPATFCRAVFSIHEFLQCSADAPKKTAHVIEAGKYI